MHTVFICKLFDFGSVPFCVFNPKKLVAFIFNSSLCIDLAESLENGITNGKRWYSRTAKSGLHSECRRKLNSVNLLGLFFGLSDPLLGFASSCRRNVRFLLPSGQPSFSYIRFSWTLQIRGTQSGGLESTRSELRH